MGVKSALKLKMMAPESGTRRRVCQSTRRLTRESSRVGDCWSRSASCGSPGGMKSGLSISKPHEPRWMGRVVANFEK